MQEVTTSQICLKSSLIIGVFFVNSMLALVIKYVCDLHERNKESNIENIKLLNGMHEGLLIL